MLRIILLFLITFTQVAQSSECNQAYYHLLAKRPLGGIDAIQILSSTDIRSLKENIAAIKTSQKSDEIILYGLLEQIDNWIIKQNPDPKHNYLTVTEPHFKVNNVQELIKDFYSSKSKSTLIEDVETNLQKSLTFAVSIENGIYDDNFNEALKAALLWTKRFRLSKAITLLHELMLVTKSEEDLLNLMNLSSADLPLLIKLRQKEVSQEKILKIIKSMQTYFPNPPTVLKRKEDLGKVTEKLKEVYTENTGNLLTYIKQNSIPITKENIQQLSPSEYSFVQLPGESFLRVSNKSRFSHKGFAYGEDVLSAGELYLREDDNGVIEIFHINNQSGTYIPPTDSLRHAIRALYEQDMAAKVLTVEYYENLYQELSKNRIILEQ